MCLSLIFQTCGMSFSVMYCYYKELVFANIFFFKMFLQVYSFICDGTMVRCIFI